MAFNEIKDPETNRVIGGIIDLKDSFQLIQDHVNKQITYRGNGEVIGTIFIQLEDKREGQSHWLTYTCGQHMKISKGEAHPAGAEVINMENVTALQHTPNYKWCHYIPPNGPWIWIGPC